MPRAQMRGLPRGEGRLGRRPSGRTAPATSPVIPRPAGPRAASWSTGPPRPTTRSAGSASSSSRSSASTGRRRPGAEPRRDGRVVRADAGALAGERAAHVRAPSSRSASSTTTARSRRCSAARSAGWTGSGRAGRPSRLGDTVLFHVRGAGLVAQFPELAAEDFGINPDGVSTQPSQLGTGCAAGLASASGTARGRRSAVPRNGRARQLDGPRGPRRRRGGSGGRSPTWSTR